MMKRTLAVLSAITMLLHSGPADAQFSGPVLGYTLDVNDWAIRVIQGIPGASAVGRAVEVDVKIGKAAVSIEQDYALAAIEGTGEIVLIGSLSGNPVVTAISGVHAGGDAIAISPDGRSAVVYSVEGSFMEVIGGLPSHPAVQFQVDTTLVGQRALTAVAITPNQQVLAAFTDGDMGTLFVFGPDTPPRFVAKAGYISAIRFPRVGDVAVVTDRAWNQVILLQDFSTTASPILLANDSDGISAPIGVSISNDASTAYVANAGSGTVTILSLAGGASRDVACNCVLTTMRELKGDAVFTLTEQADEPIVVFDGGGSGDPQFVLVPPRDRASDN